MPKYTFDEALQRLNDGYFVARQNVQSRALERKLWLAEWHIPGCLSESQSLCLTKREAIESACFSAEGENGVPRGMKTALARHGRFDSQSPMFGTCVNTVSRVTLSEML